MVNGLTGAKARRVAPLRNGVYAQAAQRRNGACEGVTACGAADFGA